MQGLADATGTASPMVHQQIVCAEGQSKPSPSELVCAGHRTTSRGHRCYACIVSGAECKVTGGKNAVCVMCAKIGLSRQQCKRPPKRTAQNLPRGGNPLMVRGFVSPSWTCHICGIFGGGAGSLAFRCASGTCNIAVCLKQQCLDCEHLRASLHTTPKSFHPTIL